MTANEHAQTTESVRLAQQLEGLVPAAEKFKADHGSCELIVASDSPIAAYKIQRVGGFRIEVADLTFISRTGKDDSKLTGSMVYMHRDDDPSFGSKADPDDDWFEDDEEGEE